MNRERSLEGRDLSRADLDLAFQAYMAGRPDDEGRATHPRLVDTERLSVRESGVTVNVLLPEDVIAIESEVPTGRVACRSANCRSCCGTTDSRICGGLDGSTPGGTGISCWTRRTGSTIRTWDGAQPDQQLVRHDPGRCTTNLEETVPYIDSDTVKAKRQAIRQAFPRKDGWDVSVSRRDYSTILVVFKKGPIALSDEGYTQINTHFIRKYAPSAAAAAALERANDIAKDGNYTLYESSDYGSVPKFYVDIHVGSWDRPYQVVS